MSDRPWARPPDPGAQNILTALFHAANRSGRQAMDVLAWLAGPAGRAPTDLPRDADMPPLADQLQGTIQGAVEGAVETRDGIYETARQCVACLLDPKIAAWVTPDPQVPQFRPETYVPGRDTLYLLSKDGGGSAAGVIAAAADSVPRAGVVAAERMGGRPDPPMTAVLDEAANVCRISDLPDLYSHLGSRGRLARQELTDPAAGAVGPAVRHRDHLGPAMAELRDPAGPFAGCKEGAHRAKSAPVVEAYGG